MATLQQLEAWLEKAEDAYQLLQIGEKAASVSGPEHGATFKRNEAVELHAYITRLQEKIAVENGGSNPRSVIRVDNSGFLS